MLIDVASVDLMSDRDVPCQERSFPVTYSRRRASGLLGLGVAGIFLTACSAIPNQTSGVVVTSNKAGADLSARFAGLAVADEPNGDVNNVVWPAFVAKADAEVQQLYAFQVTHGELMRWIPCFCGCGQATGHLNNRDCYVQAVNPDGSVVFDAMAPT